MNQAACGIDRILRPVFGRGGVAARCEAQPPGSGRRVRPGRQARIRRGGPRWPGRFRTGVPGMVHRVCRPPSPLFSQVFILKGVKVLCFHTLSQVLILKGLTLHRNCAVRANLSAEKFEARDPPTTQTREFASESGRYEKQKKRRAQKTAAAELQGALLNKKSIDDSPRILQAKNSMRWASNIVIGVRNGRGRIRAGKF
jgi:hypothetical protein